MYMSRYSLADYRVTIEGLLPGISDPIRITIGGAGENGEGSCLGEIKVTRNTELWNTVADATGSWVHNRNLDKTGTVELSLRQVSDDVVRLIQLCSSYENVTSDATGLTITVSPSHSYSVKAEAFCNDCFPVKVPDQVFGDTAAEQSWVFTCGQVKFPTNVNFEGAGN